MEMAFETQKQIGSVTSAISLQFFFSTEERSGCCRFWVEEEGEVLVEEGEERNTRGRGFTDTSCHHGVSRSAEGEGNGDFLPLPLRYQTGENRVTIVLPPLPLKQTQPKLLGNTLDLCLSYSIYTYGIKTHLSLVAYSTLSYWE